MGERYLRFWKSKLGEKLFRARGLQTEARRAGARGQRAPCY